MSTCPFQPAKASRWFRRLASLSTYLWDWRTDPHRHALDALQQSIDAVVTIDHDNRVVFYNPAAERLWGLPPADVLGRNVSILVPVQWRADHDDMIDRHRRGGPNRIVGTFREVPIERADGVRRWVSLAISKTVTRGRIGYTAFVRDVTADRDARQTIHQTLEQASDAVLTMDARLRITYCNPSAERLWGMHRTSLLGQHARVLLHPEALNEFTQTVGPDIERGMQQLASTSREIKILRGSGEVVWGRISVARIQVDERTSYTAFIKDITETRAIRVAKAAVEHRLRQLLENLPNVALIGCRADLTVTYWNRAAEATFGYLAHEAMGRSAVELLMPPWLQSRLRRSLQRMVATGVVLPPGEAQLRHKSGHLVTVQANNTALNLPGQPLELFSACVDLSERVAAEQSRHQLQLQLRESQKMEALGTLAGGVAHDFNNIVAAILGNIELALLDVGDGHAARESLYEIRKSGRRARDLVQQILTFGRGQTTVHRRINLRELILDARSMLQTAVPPGVSLEFDIDPLTPDVMGDPTQLEQVLLNLCTNAAHALAGSPSGQIAISLQRSRPIGMDGARSMIEADLSAAQELAVLSVRDDGSGMSEETLSRIFEPFFTTKPTGKGTGLGLPVVHGILRDHAASLDVASQPGLGSTFCIGMRGLPPAPTADGSEEGPAAQSPSVATQACSKRQGADTCRLAYIDDDEAIAFLMKRILGRAGYHVTTYVQPEEALRQIAKRCRDFDVVLTDYNMPRMNGIELTRALRKACPVLPILMTTGHITDGLQALAPQVGVRELIYKPDSVDDMFAAVHQAVKRLQQQSPVPI